MPPPITNQPQASTSAAHEDDDLSAFLAAAEDEDEQDDDDWFEDFEAQQELDTSHNQSGNTSRQLNTSVDVAFDPNTGGEWIFPIGFEKREYQLSISQSCLFTNTLVCLPTGLGKTFIASVVIYNFYRWFPHCKIIFMAHSRPLVNQQIDACYKIVGIPASDTAVMTGQSAREKRMGLWNSKRVFFSTPQVIQNDLKDPLFPVHAIKLVIVDEAHKAKGKYSYCEVIKEINAVNQKFRTVALSATPGKTADVIDIIRNLLIAKIEVRTEKSPDVKRYSFDKDIKIERVPLGELTETRDRFSNIMAPHLRKLIESKAITSNYFSKGYIIVQKKKFDLQNHPQKKEISGYFSIVISYLYSMDLLERHGVHSFLNSFYEDSSKSHRKYFVAQDPNLRGLLDELQEKYKDKNPLALNTNPLPNGEIPSIADKNLDFGHPKFKVLMKKVLEFFEAGGAKTIIFCEYRETVQMVYALLLQERPVVLPSVLIGQGTAVSQKDQMKAMNEFRSNKVNTLITTSVCEEGIDVGEVDLVICFDVNSKNPTRFVQRIGRTGRKRNGKVIILATEGNEEEVIKDVINSKERLNKSIHTNNEVKKSLYRNSPRLVPGTFMPRCVETRFNIPDVEEKVKVTSKGKKAPVKRGKKDQVLSIASIFKRAPKLKSNKFDPLDLDDGANDDVRIVEAPASSIKPCYEQIKAQYNKEMDEITKFHQNEMLRKHLELEREKVLKTLDNLMNEFYKAVASGDHSFEMCLDSGRFDDDSIEFHPKEIDVESPDKVVYQNFFEPQDEQFITVESRYGNQFSFGEPFTTPLKVAPFQACNTILNSTLKSTPEAAGPSRWNKKQAKKSPIEDSPLLKAFEKQRSLSSSTPVAPKAPTSYQSRVESRKTTIAVETTQADVEEKEVSYLEFFGAKSLDEIFVDTDDDEELLEQLQEIEPVPQNVSLSNNSESIINSTMYDVVIESSVVEEEVLIDTHQNMNEEIDYNFDDIFSSDDDSTGIDNLDRNIQSHPSDCSRSTQPNDVTEETARNLPDLIPDVGKSPMKENLQNFHALVSSPESPKTIRPRPNFARFLTALKPLNVVKPLSTPSPEQQNLPKATIRNEFSFVSPSSRTESPATFKSPLIPQHRQSPGLPKQNTGWLRKSPAMKPPMTRKITSFFLPPPSTSSSMVSPVSSRVKKFANPKARRTLDDSIVISDDETREQTSFALPIRKRISRKRKRNDFLDTQVEVDGTESSDDDDSSLDGFIADESFEATQTEVTEDEMRAKYLRSLRSPSVRQMGQFKLPLLAAPQNFSAIFSQMPQEDDDWEMGSFIVANDEVQQDDDEMDDLEVAERMLKEKRKRARDLRNGVKRRKVLRLAESSDEDDELEKLRKEVNENPN